MSSYYDDDLPSKRAVAGWVIFLVALFVVIGVVLAIGTWGFNWFAAPYQGKLQARQQINSGAFRIQAYDNFFNQCAQIQTDEQALQASYAELKTASKDDRSRIQTNITGQLIDRNEAANQYNADSHKSYTVGQFKSSNLPYEIPPYQKGQVISCGS
jgi:hypothetical protein